ncbi:transposase [Methylobacterium sp. WL7]|nr:transposase [Methylobacterium sp. WL7]
MRPRPTSPGAFLNKAIRGPILITALQFTIGRVINGLSSAECRRIRQEQSRPLVEDLHVWLQDKRVAFSRSASVAKPFDDMLKRWDRFAAFLYNGRICLSNNAAERGLRGFATTRSLYHPCLMLENIAIQFSL